VEVAAQLAEMSLEDFRNLNPAFNKPVILGAADQQMLLPFTRAELFQMNLASYSKPLSSWTALTVTKSETPEQLATRLALNSQLIRDVNNIPRGMRIRAGSTILIPKPPGKDSDIPMHVAEHGQLKLDKTTPPKPKPLSLVRAITRRLALLNQRQRVLSKNPHRQMHQNQRKQEVVRVQV